MTLYTLEYAPPSLAGLPRLPDAVRVERFTAAQAYNSTSMFYRPEPFQLNSYSQHRWRVAPGDLLTDFLLRDLRHVGVFGAVFSYRETERPRLALEGGVEEFLEADLREGPRAVLTVTVTLLDLTQKEMTRRLVFQRRYREEEPIPEPSAPALARGLSRAMERLSSRIIRDVHQASAGLPR